MKQFNSDLSTHTTKEICRRKEVVLTRLKLGNTKLNRQESELPSEVKSVSDEKNYVDPLSN